MKPSDIGAAGLVAVLIYLPIVEGGLPSRWPDMTPIVAGMVAMVVVLTVILRPLESVAMRRVLLLLFAFVPGAVLSSQNQYAQSKQAAFVLTLVAIVGAAQLINSEERRRSWVLWNLVVAVVLIATSQTAESGRLGSATGNTIAAGRVAGVAVVILVVLVITGAIGGITRAIALGAAAVFAIVLIDTGSRGPLLAAAATVLSVSFAQQQNRSKRFLVALLVTGGGWILLASAGSTGASRVLRSLDSESSLTGTREQLWFRAMAEIPFRAEGVGWGEAWSVLNAGSSYRQYPHNILLETFLEGGWIAGLATVTFIVGGLSALSLQKGKYDPAVFGIALFLVINAMVSGDINDNRAMWAAVMIGFTHAGSPARSAFKRFPSSRRLTASPSTRSRPPRLAKAYTFGQAPKPLEAL